MVYHKTVNKHQQEDGKYTLFWNWFKYIPEQNSLAKASFKTTVLKIKPEI